MKVLVFHGDGLFKEYSSWPSLVAQLPTGAIVYGNGEWSRVMRNRSQSYYAELHPHEVPETFRVLQILLS
jgi:hypothetical protein